MDPCDDHVEAILTDDAMIRRCLRCDRFVYIEPPSQLELRLQCTDETIERIVNQYYLDWLPSPPKKPKICLYWIDNSNGGKLCRQ